MAELSRLATAGTQPPGGMITAAEGKRNAPSWSPAAAARGGAAIFDARPGVRSAGADFIAGRGVPRGADDRRHAVGWHPDGALRLDRRCRAGCLGSRTAGCHVPGGWTARIAAGNQLDWLLTRRHAARARRRQARLRRVRERAAGGRRPALGGAQQCCNDRGDAAALDWKRVRVPACVRSLLGRPDGARADQRAPRVPRRGVLTQLTRQPRVRAADSADRYLLALQVGERGPAPPRRPARAGP